MWKTIVAAGLITMACGAHAAEPLIEVRDRIHGFVYVTYEKEWAFSPVGRHGVSMIHSKLRISFRLKRALGAKELEKAIASRRARLEKQKDVEVFPDAATVSIAGYTARGFFWENAKRKRKSLQAWFDKDGVLFELYCEGPIEKFEEGLGGCKTVAGNIKETL